MVCLWEYQEIKKIICGTPMLYWLYMQSDYSLKFILDLQNPPKDNVNSVWKVKQVEDILL
jgi:hypothetical protein